MAKVINITDRLSKEKPIIIIGEKQYEVENSVETVLKFEELALASTGESMTKAIEVALGAKALKEINPKKWQIDNFQILTIAILAAMQGLEYEEADKRFRKAEQSV